MDLTVSVLTKYAKIFLEMKGYRVNRVTNVPIRRRKNIIEKGWADLQGYSSDGKYVACEIKTIKDKFSKEQLDRLNDIVKCGGLAYICIEYNNIPTVIEFEKYKK